MGRNKCDTPPSNPFASPEAEVPNGRRKDDRLLRRLGEIVLWINTTSIAVHVSADLAVHVSADLFVPPDQPVPIEIITCLNLWVYWFGLVVPISAFCFTIYGLVTGHQWQSLYHTLSLLAWMIVVWGL